MTPIETVLNHKIQAKQASIASLYDRFSPCLTLGKVFTVATLALGLVLLADPTLSGSTAMIYTTMACGVTAGIININVALLHCKEAAQSFRNMKKDHQTSLQGIRYAVNGIMYMALGATLTLSTLSPTIPALSSVHMFFVDHNFLLPTMLFMTSIPVLLETARRVWQISTKTDYASQISFEPPTTRNLKETSKLMSQIQEQVGVEAAIAVFKLYESKMKSGTDTETLKEKVTQEIAHWNQIQKIRLCQQLMFMVLFIMSLIPLIPGVSGDIAFGLNISDSALLIVPALISLGINLLYPFKRNPHIVVPAMSEEELNPPASLS